jgi:putative (di)nucleoside polyphosphate hydrolase
VAQQFRAGVVMVVRHPSSGEIMAFERADLPGEWQLPQGGLENGEEPVEAAWRELVEETGLSAIDVDLIGEHPRWVAYEWPPEIRDKRRGQVQRWFVFRLRDPKRQPVVDGREFQAWCWCAPEWLIRQVVEFRHDAYAEVLSALPGASLPSER